jgi:phosphoesterase RecJ-like protein
VTSSARSAGREPCMVTTAEVAERLRGETKILVVSHEAPDGDALGCVVALLLVAEALGIDCRCYIPGEASFPSEYSFLPRLESVLRGKPPAIETGTTVYLVDCASLLRSNSGGFSGDAPRVNIDHHQDNPCYGELNLVDPAAPSTTAILYEVFKVGGFAVDADVATALYVGLVTDTGRFQYSNTTPAAHRMAAEWQEAGLDVNRVYQHLFESTPLPKVLLIGRALGHLQVRLGGALVVSWLDDDDFAQAGADEGHADGIIDRLREIRGVRVAVLVRERLKEGRLETKVSLRSTDGSVNVADLAQIYGGGGHVQAAGFVTDRGAREIAGWIEGEIADRIGARR